MADTLFKDSELTTKRFSCACYTSRHILDLSVEYADNGKRFVECSFEFSISGKAPFKYRLKQIWNLICGREGEMCDFILRQEDAKEMVDMLEPLTRLV